jgi:hypothetical protein
MSSTSPTLVSQYSSLNEALLIREKLSSDSPLIYEQEDSLQ